LPDRFKINHKYASSPVKKPLKTYHKENSPCFSQDKIGCNHLHFKKALDELACGSGLVIASIKIYPE